MTVTSSCAETSFIDRRNLVPPAGTTPALERRQFGNSHRELSPAAAELAKAVDQYKLINRRRYITFEEILSIVTSLGYRKVD